MALSDKIITLPILGNFKEETDKAYVKQEAGKGLIETEKVTKLDAIEEKAQVNKVEGIQINGTDLTPDGETKKINITAKDLAPDLEEYVKDTELPEQLAPYLKSTDAESTYVKEEGFDEKVKTAVGSVYRPKGSKENLEAIKAVETPTEGDVYNATDTGANYVYVGEGQGDDESGWDKLSETVDLSNYETTASITEKLAQKADSTTVTEGLAAKADKTELKEYIKAASIQEATAEDIQNLFNAD